MPRRRVHLQVNGITQLFKSGVVPANASLGRRPGSRDDHGVAARTASLGARGTVKAALATSLGFGRERVRGARAPRRVRGGRGAHTPGMEALERWRRRASAAAGRRRRRVMGAPRRPVDAAATRMAADATLMWKRILSTRPRVWAPTAASRSGQLGAYAEGVVHV